MPISRFASCPLLIGAILVANHAACQNYPTKPVRLLTAEVGGSADFASRLIARTLSASYGQQVIVDNRASGVIAPDITAKALPDGYTLLLYSNGVWTLPLIQRAPYDPIKDFQPISLTNRAPNFLVVHPSVPVNSVKELIALARAKPGQLNFGSGGTGAATHLAGELFKAMAEVDIVRVPYKGGGPALNALLGGQVQLGFPTAASVAPHVRAGRLKALGVTGAHPSLLFPEVPTIAAAGVPGYEAEQMLGVFAPARTPASIIRRLNRDIVQALANADVKERFANAGVETVGSSPEAFAAAIKADMASMGKVIRNAGIRAE